jgi:hypothetical protein
MDRRNLDLACPIVFTATVNKKQGNTWTLKDRNWDLLAVLSLLEVHFSFKSHNIRCTKLKVCTVISVGRLEVLTAVLMNVRVFLDVTSLHKDLALSSSLPPPLARFCSWRMFLACFHLDKDVACLRNIGKYSSSDSVTSQKTWNDASWWSQNTDVMMSLRMHSQIAVRYKLDGSDDIRAVWSKSDINFVWNIPVGLSFTGI